MKYLFLTLCTLIALDSTSQNVGIQTDTPRTNLEIFGSLRVGLGDIAWAEDSIGTHSVAFGLNTKAIGLNSVAWGTSTRAYVDQATAWGVGTQALGAWSTAFGYITKANTIGATVWGNSAVAAGPYSTAWGGYTKADTTYSTAWGTGTQASGYASSAWGRNTIADTSYSTAWGDGTQAIGESSTAWGIGTYASGTGSTASGYKSEALGDNSTASGYFSGAFGDNSTASGSFSVALGDNSTALGVETFTQTYAEVAIGRFNDSPVGAVGSWDINDYLFSVGIGTSYENRENALSIKKSGAIYIDAQAGGVDGLTIGNNTSLSLSGKAPFLLGKTEALNIAMNYTTIQARDDGSTANLYLNLFGGIVRVGIDGIDSDGIIRAGANGVDSDGSIKTDNDLITGAANGVINAGGGSLNASINMISDSPVTPSNVNGDEDLFIQDDLQVGGEAYKTGGGNWATASDVRLKQDIAQYNDGLEKILQIKPITFKYNNKFASLDTGEEYVGVLAQDMLEIAPYMVNLEAFGQTTEEDENGVEHIVNPGEEYYVYDSSALIYMLVNAVKEQQDQATQQLQLINELLKRIEALEE